MEAFYNNVLFRGLGNADAFPYDLCFPRPEILRLHPDSVM
jgi:hypothetical protein